MTHDDSPLRAHNLLTQQLSKTSYHWLYDKAFEKYYASGPTGGYFGPMPGGGYVGIGMEGAADASGYGSSGMMPSGGMPSAPYGMGPAGPLPGPAPGPNESDFVNVAHGLWTLLFAAVGGFLAYWLYATGPGRNESSAAASS